MKKRLVAASVKGGVIGRREVGLAIRGQRLESL